MSTQPQDDEINLIEVLQTIWDGKWAIAKITAACVAGLFGLMLVMPPQNFVATTKIKSILPEQAELYSLSNSTGILEIYSEERAILRDLSPENKDTGKSKEDELKRDVAVKLASYISLQENFIELLGRRKAFREGLKKYELLNRDNYDSDDEYDIAVARLASSIKILPPVNQKGLSRGEIRRYWSIRFEYNDEGKWLNVLDHTSTAVTDALRIALKKQFATLLKAEELKTQHRIEDLRIKRDLLISAYVKETASMLAFLEEQAAVARALEIERHVANTSKIVGPNLDDVTTVISGQRDLVSEVISNEPFYLRGYKGIEKKIELIRSRKEIEPFVEGLSEIDNEINLVENDTSLKRAKKLFAVTPVATGEGFEAASINVEATEFKYNSKRALMLALTLVFSGIIGVVYVLFANVARKKSV